MALLGALRDELSAWLSAGGSEEGKGRYGPCVINKVASASRTRVDMAVPSTSSPIYCHVLVTRTQAQ